MPKVSRVKSQRGRTYGSNIYLDVVIEMNPDLSVYESHAITEEVERLLKEQFGVFDIDVHVEPSSIPEDEILDNVLLKLKTYEGTLAGSAGIPNPPSKQLHPSSMSMAKKATKRTWSVCRKNIKFPLRISEIESISQKTKLIRYELNDQIHTSLWRRHEHWQRSFTKLPVNRKNRTLYLNLTRIKSYCNSFCSSFFVRKIAFRLFFPLYKSKFIEGIETQIHDSFDLIFYGYNQTHGYLLYLHGYHLRLDKVSDGTRPALVPLTLIRRNHPYNTHYSLEP